MFPYALSRGIPDGIPRRPRMLALSTRGRRPREKVRVVAGSSQDRCYTFLVERKLGGVVWTDHVLERLRERGIRQADALVVLKRPDKTRPAQKKGNWVKYKTFGKRRLEVVTAKNERGETVVLSVWERGVEGRKKSYFFPFWSILARRCLARLNWFLEKW